MSRVAVYSLKPIYQHGTPAGPAIRALDLARGLAAAGHEVLVVDPGDDRPDSDGALGVRSRSDSLESENLDVVILPQELVGRIPIPPVPMVVDLLDPHFLSCLFNEETPFDHAQGHYYADKLSGLAEAIRTGDHFLCAGRRQRLFYLGMMQLLGRIHPSNVRDLDDMISIVPIAASSDPPEPPDSPIFRGVLCPKDASIILWSSGIYPFLDADIVLDAFHEIRKTIPSAWLVFVGTDAPNAPEMQAGGSRLRARVGAEGLEGDGVLFLPWQPYENRAGVYLEADIGIAVSPPHLETEVGFRHRVVDMIWGGLPVITSPNNDLGDLVEMAGAGQLLHRFDAGTLARTVIAVLSNDEARDKAAAAAKGLANGPLSGKHIIGPLDAFCREPRRAPDLADPVLERTVRSVLRQGKRGGLLERLRASRDTRGGILGLILRRPPVH